MPLWDNQRFETEAKKIASTWHSARSAGGASLTELVTKTARDASLNPEQIERLSRIVNGSAFNAVFEAAKLAKEAERYPDFDIVDAKSVIATLHESAASPVEAKVASFTPLPDAFASLRERPDPLAERNTKVAHERMADNIAAMTRGQSAYAQYHNAKAAVDYTQSKMIAAECRWDDAISGVRKIAMEARWNRDNFEFNALSALGAEILPELNLLRKEAKLKPIEASSEKIAQFQDRFVGDETREIVFLKKALAERAEYKQWRTAHKIACEKFASAKKVFGVATS